MPRKNSNAGMPRSFGKSHNGREGRRGRGRYHLRLKARDVTSKSVHMDDLDTLRKRAANLPAAELARRAEIASRPLQIPSF